MASRGRPRKFGRPASLLAVTLPQDTLELVLNDHLEAGTLAAAEYAHFVTLRDILREWRHDASLRFHERSIVVVERVPARAPRRRPTVGRGPRR